MATVERPVAPPRGSRLAALDGLRLLAAFSVLAYHYTGINRDYWGAKPLVEFPSLHHLSRYGYLGVELFFIISGPGVGDPAHSPRWVASIQRTPNGSIIAPIREP